MRVAEHVVIVGGGFSGTMLAIQLLRAGAAKVSLVERAEAAGPGLAFGKAAPGHLLNVRAGNMSAYPDAPDHFVRWLAAAGEVESGGGGSSFAPRLGFGTYLKAQLAAQAAARPGALDILRGDVVDLAESGAGMTALLGDGRRIAADAAALAIGNLPPPERGIEGLPPGVWIGDPWATDPAAGLTGGDSVLVIGTGLTMVDIVLLLDARGFTGPILALSRRGLLPRAHADGGPPPAHRDAAPAATGARLVKAVRERAQVIGWRHAVDELRPFTQAMWRDASAGERGRFLRHLRAWWDVHRHRIAPSVADRIQALVDRGQLRVAAGRILAATPQGDGATVRWRPRGATGEKRVTVSRIINCTGPEAELDRSPEPLLQALMRRGAIRPGRNGLGLDVDAQMRVIGRDGVADRKLYAVGPLTRGALWEIVAVPDIRGQVAQVARDLAAA